MGWGGERWVVDSRTLLCWDWCKRRVNRPGSSETSWVGKEDGGRRLGGPVRSGRGTGGPTRRGETVREWGSGHVHDKGDESRLKGVRRTEGGSEVGPETSIDLPTPTLPSPLLPLHRLLPTPEVLPYTKLDLLWTRIDLPLSVAGTGLLLQPEHPPVWWPPSLGGDPGVTRDSPSFPPVSRRLSRTRK